MTDEQHESRSGGVNINAKSVRVGGGVYQDDKIEEKTMNRTGGTDISSQSGAINITGDVTGRDKIVTTTTTTTGVDASALVELIKAFKEIDRKIDARPEDPNVDKAELKDTVNKIQEEAKKGEQANPNKVERWLKTLLGMADDIFQVTAATLTSPVLGIGTAVKLIAEKAKSGG